MIRMWLGAGVPIAALLMASAASSGEDGASPYVVKLKGLTDTNQAGVETGLGKLESVESVSVDVAQGVARVHMKGHAFLAHSGVERALGELGVNVAAIESPKWARMEVRVIQATGGA